MTTLEDDIVQSIHIILCTSPGERVMRPDFGCGLARMRFESLIPELQTELRGLIADALFRYEPRIEVETIDINHTPFPQGHVELRLQYTIRATGRMYRMNYPFALHE